jgi:hypothetical protein
MLEASFLSWQLQRPAAVRLSNVWLGLELAPEPDQLSIEAIPNCPSYRTPPKVTLIRVDGESDRLQLLGCDGSVSADALDRVSVLLRIAGAARPELPLPNEPAASGQGEWLPGVKLAHPRLLWALQRIAQTFPFRAIYLMSGYRRETHGYHPRGRALDIFVHGVENLELFQFCRTLNDVGCGYYPHNKFVHIDVREYGSKHPSWVDVAEPGQASLYVDAWPGIDPLSISANVSH